VHAQAGWIPAFAGMTVKGYFGLFTNASILKKYYICELYCVVLALNVHII
jgi:hypothetical protein